MAMSMEGGGTLPVPTTQVKVEKLNVALQQQLNLESVKTRALGLYKTISRILEDFDAIARLNASPKWQDILGQFSMVNLELFNIVEDIKKVSKAFVVHPNNVNAENATILPVMLSTKLLPEMEAEDNCKREQLLHGMQNLPVPMQIEKLKNRIDMIGAACESAEKVIADTRKAYGLGSRQGPTTVPTIDKVQAAKIQEQENLLRAAVNSGEGLRIPRDQRNLLPPVLPLHLVDVLNVGDSTHNLADSSGVYSKNTQTSLPSNIVNPQGVMLQATGTQLMGRSVPSPSPSGVTGVTSFENASPSPLSYTNSPRSSTNLMNAPSPQQQAQQQQRQKLVQLPQHQQQLLAQQLRQSSGALGQNAVQQMHDLQGQNQQKFQQLQEQHQMQYPQSLNQQAFQNRQLQPNILQHNIGQNQINQGNPLRSHLGQFAGAANNPLFNAAQTSPNTQMMSNMPTSITPQTLLPRMQFGVPGMSAQRNHPQILGDQMYGMGASNATAILSMQQQQQLQQQQGGFGNLPTSNQNIQSGMASLQSTQQNPNYPQQRQQNQQ